MFNTSESVWNRREAVGGIVSDRLYNLTIGLVLAWGFGLNYLMVSNISAYAVMDFFGNNIWFLFGFYIVCALAGTWIYSASDNPLVSFVGYNLVVIPIGIILVPFVQAFDPQIVERAVMATGLVTVIMMLLGTMHPAFFRHIIGALTIALIAAILVQLIMGMWMGMNTGWLDWVVALIFCGYIGYDWGRANAIPKTLDNAVDSAAALYIDIINLFIRILSIMGRRN